MSNPYKSDTPEWQLYENMISTERQSLAWAADAERYQKLCVDAREKAARYKAALEKLTDKAAAP